MDYSHPSTVHTVSILYIISTVRAFGIYSIILCQSYDPVPILLEATPPRAKGSNLSLLIGKQVTWKKEMEFAA